MKYREILNEQLKILPYFKKDTILQLSGQYGLKKETVNSYINRSLARKDIIQLKRGMYVTTDFYEGNKADGSYQFYLANVMKNPSYVTSWTALQYYGLVTEVIANIISVTPKATCAYNNKAGNFVYQSIKKELFSGFILVSGKFSFFIATPSKSLFDLLYFKTRQFRGVRFGDIPKIIEELRVDIDEMDKTEREVFYKMIKKYLSSYE